MAQSHKVTKSFGSVQIRGLPVLTEDGSSGGSGDVVGPSSSVANQLPRYSDTTGKLLKSSSVTVSDSGVITSGGVVLTKATVTQATSITTGVTANGSAGVVTTVSATTAAGATSTFTVTNSSVLTTSVIQVTCLYSGTLGTAGIPYITVNNVLGGSFDVNITNVGSSALSGTVKVHFVVV